MKKWAVVVLVIAVVAGCGIEWFPDNALSHDPNKNLSLKVTNQCPVPASSTVTSSPVEIFGLVSTASISVGGDATSKFFLDGATTTPLTSGTIKPGQSVTLQHVSSSSTVNIGIVTTTLTIAGKSVAWKSATVACPNNTNNF